MSRFRLSRSERESEQASLSLQPRDGVIEEEEEEGQEVQDGKCGVVGSRRR